MRIVRSHTKLLPATRKRADQLSSVLLRHARPTTALSGIRHHDCNLAAFANARRCCYLRYHHITLQCCYLCYHCTPTSSDHTAGLSKLGYARTSSRGNNTPATCTKQTLVDVHRRTTRQSISGHVSIVYKYSTAYLICVPCFLDAIGENISKAGMPS